MYMDASPSTSLNGGPGGSLLFGCWHFLSFTEVRHASQRSGNWAQQAFRPFGSELAKSIQVSRGDGGGVKEKGRSHAAQMVHPGLGDGDKSGVVVFPRGRDTIRRQEV
jgi:hypothetical protein